MAAKSAAQTGAQPRFLYVAAGPTGGRKIGIRRAGDRKQLAQELRREHLVPLQSWALPGASAPAAQMRGKDQAELNFQLSQLLSRGVPLVEALEVAAQAVSPNARPLVFKMRELVAAGSSFSDASAYVRSFDTVTIAIYRAAERTGDLAGAAKQLSTSMRRQMAIAEKATTLMVYPAIVLSISLIVGLIMLTVVVPMIGKSLRGVGVDLPTFSAIVFDLGDFMRAYVVWWSSLLVVLIVGALIFRRAVGGFAMRLVRKLPLFKSVLLAQESARFFTVMSAMTRAGVPLADGLGTAGGAVSDPQLKRELQTLRTRLIEGGVLRVLIEGVESLPLATRRLLIAGERSGDLQAVFDTLAGDLTDEVDRRSARLMAALEPALIVFMFLIIGTLLLSILIPLMKASTGMVG